MHDSPLSRFMMYIREECTVDCCCSTYILLLLGVLLGCCYRTLKQLCKTEPKTRLNNEIAHDMYDFFGTKKFLATTHNLTAYDDSKNNSCDQPNDC